MVSSGRAAAHAFLLAALLTLGLYATAHTEGASDVPALGNEVLRLYGQGKYEEAIPLAEKALALAERAFGARNPQTLTSVNNLAALYRALRRYDKAEPLYKRAAEGFERALGADHPDTLTSLNNLAAVYQAEGRLDLAEPLYKRVLEARERLPGIDPAKTLNSAKNLAALYRTQGRNEEAAQLMKRASEPPARAAAPAQEKLPVEIVQQLRHTTLVAGVAFSPDGRFVISGDLEAKLKLWDVETGRLMRDFIGGRGPVAFSPDGRFVFSRYSGKGLRLWEVTTAKEVRSFGGSEVETIAFSPDGRFAISGGCDRRDGKEGFSCAMSSLEFWEVGVGKLHRSLKVGRGFVRSVAFSPDGHFILSGHDDKTFRLWDASTGLELHIFAGHVSRVMSVTFSPDGRTALSGSCETNVADNPGDKCSKGSLKLWDLSTGREIRSFIGHTGEIWSVAFSHDGRLALTGSGDKTLKLWDVATGKQLRSFSGHEGHVVSVAFSPDDHFAVSGSYDERVKLWDVATGKELRALSGRTSPISRVALSPDGRFALIGSRDGTLKLWDVTTGAQLRVFKGHTGFANPAFLPDGRYALSAGDATLKLWDIATGKELRGFKSGASFLSSVAVSPDGRLALSGGCRDEGEHRCREGTLELWELGTGRKLRDLSGHADTVVAIAFSPDGRLAVSGTCIDWTQIVTLPLCAVGSLKVWDVATAREQKSLGPFAGEASSIVFSPNGRSVLAGTGGPTTTLWDVASGRLVRKFENEAGNVAFSPDGRFIVGGSDKGNLFLWDVATGKQLRSLTGHAGSVVSLAFSPDGRLVLSGSDEGTAHIWDIVNGTELARMYGAISGEWLTITPQGFFSGSQRDTDMLSIVRGLELTTIGQVHQSLFNPDLVREALAGDPDGEVKRAAEAVNLEKVVDSGPAPEVTIIANTGAGPSADGLLTLAALIKDRGKGIGRVEWRLNGVTAGVSSAGPGAGPVYVVKRELALDPGENKIEVIAYNARNLLASLPAQTTIAYKGVADAVKPKLFILAIGIDKYEDWGWTPPGSSQRLLFPPLKLAAGDASGFALEMQKASAGLYSDVRVKLALDGDATAAGLEKIVQKMGAEIEPRDTFVLFAAAHGISNQGRFYLIPQDYQGGPDPAALASRAIGQDRLQDWIANRIKAKRGIILLDTCESGALVGGYTRSRVDAPASEAAVGRLHEATGRPVLTAAAAGQEALELTKLGHGVFTSALIDALYHGDTNGNGLIEISELAAHVQDLVPKLIAGGEGRAAIATRGTGGDSQSARFGSTGEDFALVNRLH